ncbi:MAG: SMP-30/gluconolactonase/LRE family protein [Betaproteobacteria bacterium]|nr:SMP-30/gluconolactonase/LRE family protein [Betaproteobacteria bacterium]
MTFHAPPAPIEAEPFAALPRELMRSGQPSSWLDANHPGSQLGCFLEGPAFDREGYLYVVDIPFGRLLRISPQGRYQVAVQYDGWPNGLAIHRDGRVFIADYRHGIMVYEPSTGRVTPHLAHRHSEGFKGVNDLTFSRNGELYFTDQGQTGIHDPTGRVYRLTAAGRLELLIDNGPSPNGIALAPDERALFVAMTRANCMWHLPLRGGGVSKAGVFAYLPGMHGPDGLAVDEAGNLAVAHARAGIVWLLSPLGEPLYRIQAKDGQGRFTNIAYGGADRKTLYITDSYRSTVFRAEMPVAGLKLYSHS